jgi:uncharacterized membrane protein
MTAILLALGSSVGYGVSDFLASRVAKRVPPVLLVLYSQALQSVVLLVVVVVASQPYSAAGLAWGTAAGAVGAAGLVAYYQALATGQTAIVAPLASSGAVLPLLVDLARGGCSSSWSTWAAWPPAGASSGSPSGSSWAPCPPPWPGRCARGAVGASGSTTRPCWARWPC